MKSVVVFSIVLVSLFSLNVSADIVSVPLDCVGNYVDGDSWSTELNLGQQFSAIDSLSIEWSGLVCAQLYAQVGYSLPEFSLPGAFIANINVSNPHSFVAQAISDQTQSQSLQPFSGTDAFTIGTGKKHYLLDGPVTLNIRPTGIGIVLGIYYPVDPSDGIIDSASLIVDGTLIPEPVTLAIFGLGALFVRRRRHN